MTVTAYIDVTDPTRITLESDFADKDRIKALLAVRWVPAKKKWALPLTWTSCITLRGTFGEELVIDPSLALWATEERANRVDPATHLRTAISLDDLPSENSITEAARVLQPEIGLFPHQAAGAAFMGTGQQVIIGDETGTGKSAQAISALRAMHRSGLDVFPALVIAPSSVKIPWGREWENWWPGITAVRVEGSPAQRRKQFETSAHVYIANWEQLHRHSKLAGYGNVALKRCIECGGVDESITIGKCQVHEREFNQIKFQTVIADEAHRALNVSLQTRALWAIGDKAKYRFALTGTPVQDNLDDLWHLLRYVAPEEFPAKTKFIDRYADVGYNSWGIMQILGIKPHMQDELQAILATRFRRMLKKVVLDFLPPILNEDRYVEMAGPQLKAYKAMQKDMLAELDGDVITTTSPLSKATRLLQFASSYAEVIHTPIAGSKGDTSVTTSEVDSDELSIDPEATEEDFHTTLKLSTPSNKIAAFMEDLKSGDFGDSSLVIFTQSRQLIELLSEKMTKDGFEHGMITGAQDSTQRQQAIDDFQSGKLKYVLVTIAAGGVGLTLTAADTMVFLQRAYSSTAMTQAKSRAHRIGSEIHESVKIVNYITRDSIEEAQIAALEDKAIRIETIVKDKDLLKKYNLI